MLFCCPILEAPLIIVHPFSYYRPVVSNSTRGIDMYLSPPQ